MDRLPLSPKVMQAVYEHVSRVADAIGTLRSTIEDVV